MSEPQWQTCPKCGERWWDSHVCRNTLNLLTVALAPTCRFCGQEARAQPAQAGQEQVKCYEVVHGTTHNVVRECELPEGVHNVLMRAVASSGKKVERSAQAGQVLTDEVIRDLWSWSATAEAECTATTQQHAFARAIEQAVLEKRVPQWLPIGTAPKGQRVMVWIADKEVGENIAFAKVWFHSDGTLGGGAEGFNGKWDLTHWMPLPPPPRIGGEKGGAA